jgi:hypothetical protein
LGDDAPGVLPEAIRLVELRARVLRYQRDMLRYLPRRDGTSVDHVLARELEDVASANAEELAAAVPGFAAALAWTVDDTELQRLLPDPDVISVEPDLGGSVTAGSSEAVIGLGAVQALGCDGSGSTVAVLGTGVSPHPASGEKGDKRREI